MLFRSPNFQIETQLVSYDKPNFTLDAELYEIKTPTKAQIYSRKNPICNNPLVTIRNTGSTTLTALDITYGVEGIGTTPSVYHWTGSLKFMELQDVRLSAIQWTGSNGTFYATVSAPNGGADQYSYNNTIKTTYSAPPQFPNDIIIEFKSNLYPNENSYMLKDDLGNTLLYKSTFTANTVYKDTVHLTNGCYEFTLLDNDDDGLSFWANSDGAGYIRIRRASDGVVIKTFNADFGSQVYCQFTVGYYLNHNEVAPVESIELYPNPSAGKFTLDMALPTMQDVDIKVFDIQGKQVMQRTEKGVFTKVISIDLGSQNSGIYFVSIRTALGLVTKKIIVQK